MPANQPNTRLKTLKPCTDLKNTLPMANPTSKTNPTIDPNSGFCSKTHTFHSLRPEAPLPPESAPISITDYVFTLLKSSPPPPSTAALIDSTTRHRILYPELILRVKTLSSSLITKLHLSKNDTALILSANSLHIPVLYLSLLSIGVIVSPANPASTNPEISRQIQLSKPIIAFATTETAHKLPSSLPHGTVLIDSPEFESLMTTQTGEIDRARVLQSDPAAILYSSGTTGKVKGVVLSHRNLTAQVASGHAVRAVRETPAVWLSTVPYFHSYGFTVCVRNAALGETLVTMTNRFDLKEMFRAIEEFRVSHVALSPPVVVAMVKYRGFVDGYDLRSLEAVGCGGASLQNGVIDKFRELFPKVHLLQAYGLTESTGRFFATMGPKESRVVGATGRLLSNCQAKIVDPDTGFVLPPFKAGELWLNGPFIMKGYVGDKEATDAVLDSEGWFRTGDLCFIDSEGFLFFVDRIKELIKYKGYQVPPAELEHLLQSHPDIVDAAVVPFPDEEAGQVPMAFVVRRIGSVINESQIKDFIAKQVAPYKRIRRVMFVDSIPKNAPGKVLRKELIKLAVSTTISKL